MSILLSLNERQSEIVLASLMEMGRRLTQEYMNYGQTMSSEAYGEVVELINGLNMLMEQEFSK